MVIANRDYDELYAAYGPLVQEEASLEPAAQEETVALIDTLSKSLDDSQFLGAQCNAYELTFTAAGRTPDALAAWILVVFAAELGKTREQIASSFGSLGAGAKTKRRKKGTDSTPEGL